MPGNEGKDRILAAVGRCASSFRSAAGVLIGHDDARAPAVPRTPSVETPTDLPAVHQAASVTPLNGKLALRMMSELIAKWEGSAPLN